MLTDAILGGKCVLSSSMSVILHVHRTADAAINWAEIWWEWRPQILWSLAFQSEAMQWHGSTVRCCTLLVNLKCLAGASVIAQYYN